uniref:Putative nuclear receptor-binding factor 2 n=1 Tax=Tabanus bromius TaxID=304241 RepID=A0A0K8TNI1_TABBR
MENSYLNTAHYHGRKAESHTKYRRFDEAIKHHEKAMVNLTEAIKCTSSKKAEECLILQRDNHKRQIELLLLKKAHYEKYKKALEYSRKDLRNDSDQLKKTIKTTVDLQLAIYKNMEDTDSLLEVLESSEASNRDVSTGLLKGIDINDKSRDGPAVSSDLRKLNRQLHMLVHHLVLKLDESTQENQELRNKISELENVVRPKLEDDIVKRNVLATALVEDNFEYSSSGDRSPDAYEAREIPPLAPLELPKFNFDSFDSKTSDN